MNLLTAIAPQPTSSGLVADLPMAEFSSGAVIWDRTGDGYDGTATNSPTLAHPGVDLTAASSQYVDIGTGPNLVKTVSLWVKPDDIAGTDLFISLNNSDYLGASTGAVTVVGFTAPSMYVDGTLGTSGVTTMTARWTHIVATDTTAANASNLDIGRLLATYYDGLVADVRLYDRALTAQEIFSLYNLQRRKYGR